MYVKPAARQIEGKALVVRDPDLLDFLPAEGREVPDSDYWHRRLRDGDVVLASPLKAFAEVAEVKLQPGEITDQKAYADAIKRGTIRELPDTKASKT